MITKQQALEFIYKLSEKHEVTINGKTGFIGINPHFDIEEETFYYEYEECAYENSLEAAITAFVRHYINYDILKDFDIIPVDIGMLEVGQTYKVWAQQDWEHNHFTAKFLGFDEEDDYVLKFENNKPITKYDVREMYKVK